MENELVEVIIVGKKLQVNKDLEIGEKFFNEVLKEIEKKTKFNIAIKTSSFINYKYVEKIHLVTKDEYSMMDEDEIGVAGNLIVPVNGKPFYWGCAYFRLKVEI